MNKPYPKVMVCNGGLKVLFYSESTGHVLATYAGWRKGEFYRNWNIEVLAIRECGVVLTNYEGYEKGFYDTRWNMAAFNDCDDPIPELRYLFDGEKEIISLQNNNLPLKRI